MILKWLSFKPVYVQDSIVASDHRKHSCNEMCDDLNHLGGRYNDLLSISDIGES